MQAFWHGAGAVGLYFAIAASTAFLLRFLVRIPDEMFRKGLHFILLGSYILFVFSFETWWHAAIFAVAIMIALYPIIGWFERFRSFTKITTERKKHEFKHSLLLAFSMLTVCMAICWGWQGDRHLVLACMYAWGVGDAFAALIGKRFGKHKIRLPHADHHKSVEGSGAMFVTSALAVMGTLLWRGGLQPAGYVLIPLAGAAATTVVELFTPDGMDTVTCPTAALFVVLPLTLLLGGAA